jgi:hypothetical protein
LSSKGHGVVTVAHGDRFGESGCKNDAGQ